MYEAGHMHKAGFDQLDPSRSEPHRFDYRKAPVRPLTAVAHFWGLGAASRLIGLEENVKRGGQMSGMEPTGLTNCLF